MFDLQPDDLTQSRRNTSSVSRTWLYLVDSTWQLVVAIAVHVAFGVLTLTVNRTLRRGSDNNDTFGANWT
jgi:hypothetical protein